MSTRLLIGPELYWLIVYLMAKALAKANVSNDKSLDQLLESLWWILPIVALLSFALWWVPGAPRGGWLIVRLFIAGLVGGHLALAAGLAGHSEQGPGIGTAYIVGIGAIGAALVLGVLVCAFFKNG